MKDYLLQERNDRLRRRIWLPLLIRTLRANRDPLLLQYFKREVMNTGRSDLCTDVEIPIWR